MYVLYGLTPIEVSRYQCRESRLIATIVYYPIAFINNVVVPWYSWPAHSIQFECEYLWVFSGGSRGCSIGSMETSIEQLSCIYTVQNSNESLMSQLFNIQKVACITMIFKCTLFTFSQSKICYCSALSQLGTIPHHIKYKVLREPRSLSDAGAAGLLSTTPH